MAKEMYVGADNFTKRNLPDGYTQVEYIQSTGTQYIDTGVVATQNIGYEIDFLTDSALVNNDNFGSIMGAIASGTNRFGFDTYTARAGGALYYGKPIYDPNIVVGKRMTISLRNGVLKTPTAETTLPAETFNVGGTIALFARKWNTGRIDGYSETIVWPFLMYDGDVLIRDYVPCVNLSGEAGLYDFVDAAFCGNEGTGTFVTGPAYKADVAREVEEIDIGVNGVAREIQEGYVGVNGVARQFWQKGTPISTLSVDETVWMNVNGTAREFIIVNQGIPSDSDLYDSSCDGTWLMMKDAYEKRAWDSSNNDYENSDIHAYLNGTFLSLFDSDMQNVIKQVKIPYWKGTGSSGSVASGSDGLSAKIFLLSPCEDVKQGTSGYPQDGAQLEYFAGCDETDDKLRCYYSGAEVAWWQRSPDLGNDTHIHSLYGGMHPGTSYYYQKYGIRPLLILPSDTCVDENMNVLT